jgi:hypothetical protein
MKNIVRTDTRNLAATSFASIISIVFSFPVDDASLHPQKDSRGRADGFILGWRKKANLTINL